MKEEGPTNLKKDQLPREKKALHLVAAASTFPGVHFNLIARKVVRNVTNASRYAVGNYRGLRTPCGANV